MTQYARPDSDDPGNDGTWVNESDTTPLWSSIDEAVVSDSDYVYISDAAGEDFEVGLGTVTDPGSAAGDHKVYYRASDDSGTSVNTVVVTLKQGSTTIATDTQGIDSLITTYEFTIDPDTEVDNIDDYSDLRLSFSADESGMPMGSTVTIYQAYFACPTAVVAEITDTQSFSLVVGGAMGTSFSLIGDIDVPPKVRI